MNAARAAAIFAVDPAGLGGVLLRGSAGPDRDQIVQMIDALLAPDAPRKRAPISISDDRLLGGLDLAATLATGRPVGNRGVLAEAHGGVLTLPMAERISSETVARIAAAMDLRAVESERDGMKVSAPASFAVIALDESVDGERVHPALADRLALIINMDKADEIDDQSAVSPEQVRRARECLRSVIAPDVLLEKLVAAASAFGVDSVRACVAAVHAARINAALEGRDVATEHDAAIAARFILSPRARRLPEQEDAPAPTPEQSPPDSGDESGDDQTPRDDAADQQPGSLDDEKEMIIDAIRAAIPVDMLSSLAAPPPKRAVSGLQGKGSLGGRSARRGRPAGARAGELRAGARLALLDTLRAAAPRQLLRRMEIERRNESAQAPSREATNRIHVRREDFRIRQFRPRTLVTTIFVVDASGSAALNRLSEAKGAVQALLAQCYVRRDEVALIAFRGKSANVLLPPTRSLTRVRRRLAQLPGGGGTPLASGIAQAMQTALQARQRGAVPVLVFLTDGEANVSLAGAGGRDNATADVTATSKALKACNIPTIVVDMSPRPNPKARKLSEGLAARYIPLPAADATRLASAVRAHMPA